MLFDQQQIHKSEHRLNYMSPKRGENGLYTVDDSHIPTSKSRKLNVPNKQYVNMKGSKAPLI